MPVHPRTGLTAIGIGKRGPIWPVMGASPDDPSNDDHDDTASGASGSGGSTEKKFSQADLDRIVGERVGQERAKYPDYDKYKADSSELAGIKDADKTDDQRFADLQAQLNTEKSAREAAEAKANNAELAQLRSDRASEKEGFPRSLVKRLTGTTTEEIDAEIEEIMTDLKITVDDRRPDGSGGSSRSGGNQAKPSTMAAGAELYEKLHPKSK